MSDQFEKVLSKNDTGETGGHQAGVLIPKTNTALVAIFPPLDPKVKNPRAAIDFFDDGGAKWSFQYIYYNNAPHDADGTRNEYRVTHMTGYFRQFGAKAG